MKTINAIATIAYRDFTKFRRDRTRILATFIFPFLFIGILGGSLQANLSDDAGYNFLAFVFTGVVAQVMFQSTASGIISLIEDRANDFSQELFVSPVSRYTIIFAKIIGETSVSLVQAIGIIFFALVVGVPISISQFIAMIPAILAAAVFGGSFGVLVLANLNSERSANQLFPFVIFPQFFLAGVFSPIKNLPPILNLLSIISPMRYAVDLVRGLYYQGTPAYSKVVIASPIQNVSIMIILFAVFMSVGTLLFVRNEKNR